MISAKSLTEIDLKVRVVNYRKIVKQTDELYPDWLDANLIQHSIRDFLDNYFDQHDMLPQVDGKWVITLQLAETTTVAGSAKLRGNKLSGVVQTYGKSGKQIARNIGSVLEKWTHWNWWVRGGRDSYANDDGLMYSCNAIDYYHFSNNIYMNWDDIKPISRSVDNLYSSKVKMKFIEYGIERNLCDMPYSEQLIEDTNKCINRMRSLGDKRNYIVHFVIDNKTKNQHASIHDDYKYGVLIKVNLTWDGVLRSYGPIIASVTHELFHREHFYKQPESSNWSNDRQEGWVRAMQWKVFGYNEYYTYVGLNVMICKNGLRKYNEKTRTKTSEHTKGVYRNAAYQQLYRAKLFERALRLFGYNKQTSPHKIGAVFNKIWNRQLSHTQTKRIHESEVDNYEDVVIKF